MSDFESSIEQTVRDLGTVTEEISRLRSAVASHREAASGLESIGTALSELTRQLARLPSNVEAQFSGVSQAVANLDVALRPAGALETSVHELVASNERLLGQLSAERESLRSELQGFREDLSRIQAAVQERALSSDLATLATANAAGFSQLNSMPDDIHQLSVATKEQAAAQARETGAIKARLAKLTGLARRGFFAILRGKDAPPDPL